MTGLAALLEPIDSMVTPTGPLAQAPPEGPPWLVLVLALITAVTAIGGPLLLKRLDRNPPNEVTATPTPPAADGSVDLVSDAMLDARRERDVAQDRAEQLAQELADTRVLLAVAEALLDAHQIRRPDRTPRGEGGGGGVR